MNIDVDWTIIPTHTIDVSTINAPYDISLIMKALKIDKYCYQIMYKSIVIKYGINKLKNGWHDISKSISFF